MVNYLWQRFSTNAGDRGKERVKEVRYEYDEIDE